MVNVNLGAPYEAVIKKIIDREYAGNQTEVIRQALLVYERVIDEEEVILVNRAINDEMRQIKSGKLKTMKWEDFKKKKAIK